MSRPIATIADYSVEAESEYSKSGANGAALYTRQIPPDNSTISLDVPAARENADPPQDFDTLHSEVLHLLGASAEGGSLAPLFVRSCSSRLLEDAVGPSQETKGRNAVEVVASAIESVASLSPRTELNGCGSSASTPRSEINELISIGSSDDGLINNTVYLAASTALNQGPRLRPLGRGPPRRLRVDRPGAHSILGTLRIPIDLDAAKKVVRPRQVRARRQPQIFPETACCGSATQPAMWEKTTPVGLLPTMRIPGRYALAMKPCRDMCRRKTRARH